MARANVRRTRAVVLDVRPGRPHRTGAEIETAGATTAIATDTETAITRETATATRTEDETTTTIHLVGIVIATGGKTVNVHARGTGMSRPGGGTRTAIRCMSALCVILD